METKYKNFFSYAPGFLPILCIYILNKSCVLKDNK